MENDRLREKIAFEFYKAKALAGDMPFSQAVAVRTVMADLAYAKADQILSLVEAEKEREIEEVRGKTIQAVIDWLQGDINNAGKRTAGLPSLRAIEGVVLQTVINALKEYRSLKASKEKE